MIVIFQVDEANLNFTDRLGLAYCRLNLFEWDDIVGSKPPDFDELPCTRPDRLQERINCKSWRKYKRSRHQYVMPVMKAIRLIIGDANVSRCWWIFAMGKSEEEWLQRYVADRADLFRE